MTNGNEIRIGLQCVADSLDRVAEAIQALGNGDAATSMGAIESFGLYLSHAIKESAESVAEAIRSENGE